MGELFPNCSRFHCQLLSIAMGPESRRQSKFWNPSGNLLCGFVASRVCTNLGEVRPLNFDY